MPTVKAHNTKQAVRQSGKQAGRQAGRVRVGQRAREAGDDIIFLLFCRSFE